MKASAEVLLQMGTSAWGQTSAQFKLYSKSWKAAPACTGAHLRGSIRKKSIKNNTAAFTSQPGQYTSSRCDNHILTVPIADNGWHGGGGGLYLTWALCLHDYNLAVCLSHITDAKSKESKQKPVFWYYQCKVIQAAQQCGPCFTFNFSFSSTLHCKQRLRGEDSWRSFCFWVCHLWLASLPPQTHFFKSTLFTWLAKARKERMNRRAFVVSGAGISLERSFDIQHPCTWNSWPALLKQVK